MVYFAKFPNPCPQRGGTILFGKTHFSLVRNEKATFKRFSAWYFTDILRILPDTDWIQIVKNHDNKTKHREDNTTDDCNPQNQ